MKKYLIVLVLAIAVAFCLGCNNDESSAPAGDEDSPTAGATMPEGASGMPGSTGMPGASGMPGSTGMPGASGMPGATGMPGASGMPGMMGDDAGMGMAGATATSAAEAAPTVELKTLEEEFKGSTVKRDETGEVRAFYNPSAMNKKEGTHLTELQSREVALAFIRQYYYYFDSMSFEYRPSAGVLKDGVYSFKWIQKIRDTKKTGNEIFVTVNPNSGLVVKYTSTRKNWDN